jgi:hypothetical protein
MCAILNQDDDVPLRRANTKKQETVASFSEVEYNAVVPQSNVVDVPQKKFYFSLNHVVSL